MRTQGPLALVVTAATALPGRGTSARRTADPAHDCGAAANAHALRDDGDMRLRSLRVPRSLKIGLVALVVGAGAAGAAAAAVPPHNPVGHADAIYGTNARTILVRGWADDPDYPKTVVAVDIYIDGHSTRVHTGLSRPDVAKAFPRYGTRTGFWFQGDVPTVVDFGGGHDRQAAAVTGSV